MTRPFLNSVPRKTKSWSTTVAICTRDRGEEVVRAAASVLANENPALRVMVVDQSRDETSERALHPLRSDPRLLYVKSHDTGLSKARNVALRLATTDTVLFTDDDCEVPCTWVADFCDEIALHPGVVVAFCNVVAGPHDASSGFVPNFKSSPGTRVLRDPSSLRPNRGIGAGLFVRREPVLALGGFDELLGAGGPFGAAEDFDIAVRALLAGAEVLETDRTFVVHHGFRTWVEGRALARRDFVGIGAAFVKPLRVGRWDFAPIFVEELVVNVAWPPLRDLLHGRRPRGLARTGYFLWGAARGFHAPLDRRPMTFVAPAPTRTAPSGEDPFTVDTPPSEESDSTACPASTVRPRAASIRRQKAAR